MARAWSLPSVLCSFPIYRSCWYMATGRDGDTLRDAILFYGFASALKFHALQSLAPDLLRMGISSSLSPHQFQDEERCDRQRPPVNSLQISRTCSGTRREPKLTFLPSTSISLRGEPPIEVAPPQLAAWLCSWLHSISASASRPRIVPFR